LKGGEECRLGYYRVVFKGGKSGRRKLCVIFIGLNRSKKKTKRGWRKREECKQTPSTSFWEKERSKK